MFYSRWLVSCLAFNLMLCACSALAQVTPATQEFLAIVPEDAIAMATLKPREIASAESMRMLPLEVATAAGMQYLGVDPLKIERIDYVMGLPLGGVMNLPVAAQITHGEDIPKQAISRLLPQGPVTEKGLEFWAIPNSPDMVAHFRSPRQLMIGSRSYITRLLKLKQSEGELRTAVARAGEPTQFALTVVFEQMRELLVGLADSPQLQQMQIATHVKTVAEKTKVFSMKTKLNEPVMTEYSIEAASPADAAELSKAISALVKFGGNLLVANLQNEVERQPGRVPQATLAYVKRIQRFLEQRLDLKPQGNQLSLKLEGEEMAVGQVGVLVGLLLPAVQSSREAARTMQSLNNLKQSLLAIHNWEATYRKIPNDAAKIITEKGPAKGRLSWRVKILPFIEGQQLYNQFHLDEDWDSPHNIQLLQQMPAVFRDPSSTARPGHTVYQMPSGPGMGNAPDKEIGFRNITDGTSNSVAIIVTTDAAAVPWTQPDEADPIAHPEILAQRGGAYLLGYFDGSVQRLSVNADRNLIKAIFTIAGGEPTTDLHK